MIFDIPFPPDEVATLEPTLYLFTFVVIALVVVFIGILRYIVKEFIGALREQNTAYNENAEKQAERDQTILETLKGIVRMMTDLNAKVDEVDRKIPNSRRFRDI